MYCLKTNRPVLRVLKLTPARAHLWGYTNDRLRQSGHLRAEVWRRTPLFVRRSSLRAFSVGTLVQLLIVLTCLCYIYIYIIQRYNHIYMHISIYLSICLSVSLSLSISLSLYIYIYIYIYVIHIYIYIYIHICIHTCNLCVYICVYIYIYIYMKPARRDSGGRDLGGEW